MKSFYQSLRAWFGDGSRSTGKIKHEFTPEQADKVARLVGRIVEKGQSFKLFPPKEVTDDPSVLRSNAAPTRLAGTKWRLRFAEDDEQLLTFAELMVLTRDIVTVYTALAEAKQRLSEGELGKLEIKAQFDEQLMTAESVRRLLGKLRIEGIDPRVTYPVYGIHEGGPDEAFRTALRLRLIGTICGGYTIRAATRRRPSGRGRHRNACGRPRRTACFDAGR